MDRSLIESTVLASSLEQTLTILTVVAGFVIWVKKRELVDEDGFNQRLRYANQHPQRKQGISLHISYAIQANMNAGC